MCGILFSYRPDLATDAHRAMMQTGLQCLRHRGPDDGDLWLAGPTAVAHRRLSIIDLGGSRQPMHDRAQRYVLTYNGEIYNYRELREGLTAHWSFQTQGDTEVVLAGLVLQGAAFLEKMEGMWALALWDDQTRALLLARDRMGKKPLYYTDQPDKFACASELSALAAVAGPWAEDLDSTADYLRYGYYLPGTTAYRGVHEVLPGHYAIWQPAKSLKQHPFWTLRHTTYSGTELAAREELNDKLTRAVARRMVADVEVGAFLSGGIDSSLVVGLMHSLDIRPKTFTIGFVETAFDERRYARTVAKRFNTDHYEEVLSDWNESTLEKLVLDHVGQPFADSSLLPTALVSQLAARHVKVALSGDGGDELFSGYQRYQARSLLRWYTRLPQTLRNTAEAALRALPEPMAHHSRSVLKKAHLFLDILARRDSETPYIAPVYYARNQFRQLAPDLVDRGHPAPALAAETNNDDIAQMMLRDALIYLPQDILVKVDRASMAHSLEARAPFLDREVVELAFALPRPWHRRGLTGKRMLHRTFRALLPENIWHRRKQGFGVPIHAWFRGTLGKRLHELLHAQPHALQTQMVETMLMQHQERRRDHGYRLWSIYIYLLWRQRTWRAS